MVSRRAVGRALEHQGLSQYETKLLLEAVNHLVQGPKYVGDYQNTEKYGKYQYVKLKVR